MSSNEERISDAIVSLEQDAEILNQFTNGSETETVETGTGVIPTVAKLVVDLQVQVSEVTTEAVSAASSAAISSQVSAEAAAAAELTAETVLTATGNANDAAAIAQGFAAIAGNAATDAKTASDAAQLSSGLKSSVAEGLATTTDGQYFSVPSASVNDFLILYLNDGGNAVEAGKYPSSAKVDAIAGPNPASVPQIFESLDDLPQAVLMTAQRQILASIPDKRVGELQQTSVTSAVYETLDQAGEGEVWIRDANGKIIARLASASISLVVAALSATTNVLQETSVKSNFYESLDQAGQGEIWIRDGDGKIIARLASSSIVSVVDELSALTNELNETSVKSQFYETLDPSAGVLFVDAQNRVLGSVGSLAPITAELASAAGAQTSLSNRLAKGLTPFGDVLGPYANRWSVRDARMRLERREAGDVVQWVIALLGDSYSNDRSFYSAAFAKRLHDRYGMAGVGWVGFGWYTSPITGTWTAGSQPVGVSGSVRSDLVPICHVIGTWACAYNNPASNMPALYKVTSSTPDDYVRFTVPAAGGAYTNSCRLFYSGDGTGVIAVSWDDGVTYGANIALSTVGADNVNLSGIPAAGGTARIKVVSGNVGLGGVDLQNTAPGVRVHKLGSSGARSVQWATVGTPWRAQMLALGSHTHQFMIATNDQTDASLPASVASNISTVFANLTAVFPYADKVLAMPAENQRTTNVYGMPLYAKAGREYAVQNDVGFVDLQYFFGSPANFAADYAASNRARPWYGSDLIHPAGPTGGKAISSALFNFYTQP